MARNVAFLQLARPLRRPSRAMATDSQKHNHLPHFGPVRRLNVGLEPGQLALRDICKGRHMDVHSLRACLANGQGLDGTLVPFCR